MECLVLVPGPRQTVLVCKWRGSNEKALRPAGEDRTTGRVPRPRGYVCVSARNVHVHQMNNKRRRVERGPVSRGAGVVFLSRMPIPRLLASEQKRSLENLFGQQRTISGPKLHRQRLYVAHLIRAI